MNPSIRLSLFATGICALLAAGVLSSCNTVGGFGNDIEKTGDAIKHAAR